MICPCGSGKVFGACCGLYLSGAKAPEGAEALMRSRYTAYTMGNGRYLVETTLPEKQVEADVALIEEHAASSEWYGLEVLSSVESGDEGWVEFKAFYKAQEQLGVHHEKSRFECRNGCWFYDEGELFEVKIGRNDPCPCGSGKKYKKCCG